MYKHPINVEVNLNDSDEVILKKIKTQGQSVVLKEIALKQSEERVNEISNAFNKLKDEEIRIAVDKIIADILPIATQIVKHNRAAQRDIEEHLQQYPPSTRNFIEDDFDVCHDLESTSRINDACARIWEQAETTIYNMKLDD